MNDEQSSFFKNDVQDLTESQNWAREWDAYIREKMMTMADAAMCLICQIMTPNCKSIKGMNSWLLVSEITRATMHRAKTMKHIMAFYCHKNPKK